MKYPIYINENNESGYIGIKKSSKKLELQYIVNNKIEKRDHFDTCINFYLTEEKRIKAVWINYKTNEQFILYNGYIKSHDKVFIKKFLLAKLKKA